MQSRVHPLINPLSLLILNSIPHKRNPFILSFNRNSRFPDGLQAYKDAFKKEFYTNKSPRTKHVRNAGIAKKNNNNRVERLHNTVRERDKVMRGMQNNDTARVLMDGFRNYYNFLRPHMGIENNTPAEIAGLNLELGRNKIQNLIKQSAGLPC